MPIVYNAYINIWTINYIKINDLDLFIFLMSYIVIENLAFTSQYVTIIAFVDMQPPAG